LAVTNAIPTRGLREGRKYGRYAGRRSAVRA
jgi:hypothetical protein